METEVDGGKKLELEAILDGFEDNLLQGSNLTAKLVSTDTIFLKTTHAKLHDA